MIPPSHLYAILPELPMALESQEVLQYLGWRRLTEDSMEVAMAKPSPMLGEDFPLW